MSPKNSVEFLNEKCLNAIVNEILFLLNDVTEKNIKTALEKYITHCATHTVLNDILKTVLASSQITSKEKYLCLKYLIRSDITEFNLMNFSPSYHAEILKQLIQTPTSNIQHLNLTNLAAENCPELLTNALKLFANIRILKIPNIVNDSCLEIISKMNNLHYLDISGSVNYSEASIKQFQSNSIRILSIGETKQTSTESEYLPSIESVSILIKNLPNLTALHVYNFGGKALQKLNEHEKTIKTKLCYIRDKNSTPESIQAVVNSCPDLERLELYGPSLHCAKSIKQFRKLQCLKLVSVIKDELESLLTLEGNVLLNEINIEKVNSTVEFAVLTRCKCVTLKCTKLSLSFTDTISNYADLSYIELISCDVPDKGIKLLLSKCQNLRRFAFGGETKLTHSDFLQIREANPLKFLEEFWLSHAKFLTAVTVQLLIEHCDKLKLIGQLSCWDIERDEINYLRFNVCVTNVRVNLLYFPSLTFRF